MKKIYSFLILTLGLALGSANALAQSITVSPDEIFSDAGGNGGTLTVTYDGYDVSQYYPSFQFYDADGITPVGSGTYSWLANSVFLCLATLMNSITDMMQTRGLPAWPA